MTKQDILNTTGLSEEEFYQRYPDQETFCSEYPDMCPDMMEDNEEEDISNYQNLGYDESEINMAAYGGSMYEAQDGVETTAPYTDYNQYTNAMQNYGAEASKAGVYNNFQNDLYNQSGTSRGSRETTSQLGDMFNTLSPEQQDALAQKYGAQFMPSSTPSASRRNYVNSMEMNVPGKGTGYYSFPTNYVVYGSKQLERPKYDFPAMTMAPYKMPVAPPKKFSVEPTQLINNISAGYKNPASLNTNNGNLPIPKYSMANTMEKVGATNKPYVASAPNYTSIIDLLKARKQDSSFTNRKRLAEEAGIKNYTGSASQNMDFINRMNGIKSSGAEMELGGENMFVNGGLVKYQKKGEVKQNSPKIYTDRKKFEQAQKLYADSLYLHNNPVTVTRDFPGSIDIDLNKDVTSSFKNVTNPFGARYVAHPLKKTNKKLLNDLVEHQIKMRTVPDYDDDPEIFERRKKRDKNLIDPLLKMKKTGFQPVAATEPSYFGHTMFFKKPVQPVTYQSAPTHPIENLEKLEMMTPSLNGSNIQMQGQLLPIPQMRLPQRGNIPFYGPGNSIIGYTDGNMQFYPAQQYTGAPNNQLNLQDKELLDNPEMLQRYILSRDNYNFELGGANIHPAMRTNFKQGGYYGMDGRLHKAKGSGTYVMNGGYYFQPGGTNTAPPATGSPIDDYSTSTGSSITYDNMPNEDGTIDIDTNEQYSFEDTPEEEGGFFGNDGMGNARQQRRRARRNAPYEMNDLGGLDSAYEQQNEQPIIQSYDPSEYSSAVDPVTGFTNYSKGNKALTNIKKQDNALWQQLKNEGNGARFRTGQTDVQKFGRAAGKVGATLDAAINVAGAFGNILNNKFQQRSLNNSAINKGSTASMYTNPQGAGKGDYGQTGSSYGMMNPSSVGARSFKGMYGKYGMEVPKYDIGGFVPQISTLSDVGLESMAPESINVTSDYLPSFTPTGFAVTPRPVVDNTGVYQNNRAVANNASSNMPTGTLDPDFALQSIATFESGSKPGQTKVGMGTKIIGEGGKKASASGTYQITTPTLQDIYNNDKSISSKYNSFNKFKSAFDVDANVEYEAAKSLMSRNIKKYGVYALGAWYYPEFARKAAAGDKSVFDMVPRRDFGNNVKWGDDFNKKLNAYNKIAGTNYTPTTTFNAPPPVAQKKYTTPPGENPMARKTFRDFQTEFSGITNMGIWGDARHKEKKSDHNTADALDIGIKDTNQGNQVVQKLIKEAKDRNIKYIIFNSRIWDAKTNTWSAYDGDNPHKTHVHTSFNRVKKQLGGQVMEMDEDEIKQFLKAGGQLEFLD